MTPLHTSLTSLFVKFSFRNLLVEHYSMLVIRYEEKIRIERLRNMDDSCHGNQPLVSTIDFACIANHG